MVESTFRTGEDLLVTTFRNSVTVGDLAKALAAYAERTWPTQWQFFSEIADAIAWAKSGATDARE